MSTEWEYQVEVVILDCVGKTLGIPTENIQMSNRLYQDLGLDSIDMMDILYGIEKRLGVVIQLQDFAQYFRGDLTEDQFCDENGQITDKGFSQLKQLFPTADLQKPLHIRHVFQVLSVHDLIQHVRNVPLKEVV